MYFIFHLFFAESDLVLARRSFHAKQRKLEQEVAPTSTGPVCSVAPESLEPASTKQSIFNELSTNEIYSVVAWMVRDFCAAC